MIRGPFQMGTIGSTIQIFCVPLCRRSDITLEAGGQIRGSWILWGILRDGQPARFQNRLGNRAVKYWGGFRNLLGDAPAPSLKLVNGERSSKNPTNSGHFEICNRSDSSTTGNCKTDLTRSRVSVGLLVECIWLTVRLTTSLSIYRLRQALDLAYQLPNELCQIDVRGKRSHCRGHDRDAVEGRTK